MRTTMRVIPGLLLMMTLVGAPSIAGPAFADDGLPSIDAGDQAPANAGDRPATNAGDQAPANAGDAPAMDAGDQAPAMTGDELDPE